MNRIALRGKHDFEPSGFFVVRSPLLPWNELETWSSGLEGSTVACPILPEALARDVAKLRERLRVALLRKEIREALFVASPALEEALEIWLQDPEGERGSGLELALVRYYQRMCGRPTPFGLWAGISLGSLAQRTRLRLAPNSAYERHTRPEMDYLCSLIARLQQEPQVRALLAYRPNSSLYQLGGQLCYTEHWIDGKAPRSVAVSVERTKYLNTILNLAEAGASIQSLAEAIVGDEVSRTEAEGYIEELISSQILVSTLACPVTGAEPLSALLDRLPKHAAAASGTKAGLELLRRELVSMDQAGLGHPPKQYRELSRQTEALTLAPAPPMVKSTHVDPSDPVSLPISPMGEAIRFHVDLVKPAMEATIGEAVLTEIARGAEWLCRLNRRPANTELARFRDAFQARYENREVPLLEALDEECGIGFKTMSPALDLPRDETPPLPSATDHSVQWGGREEWLLRRLNNALSDGKCEITLEPQELDATGEVHPPLPDAFAVMATVASTTMEALDQGQFQVLIHGIVGPSGANLLGRFCHASESLRKLVQQHIHSEEALRPEAVFAEIVHLPEARIGNLLLRPLLRSYEIPFLGASGIAPERQLPVSDLWLSLRGERLVLRSARLGKQVIPRITNRHKYSLSRLPVYRFLCALVGEGVFQGGWDWGPLWQAPFLPRVSSGRLVFALATWNLRAADLRPLRGRTAAESFQAAQMLRAKRHLPRWMLLQDEDLVLPVDFDNWFSLKSFIQLVHQREQATLTEIFPGQDQLILHGPEGKFAHELIVPFVRLPKNPLGVDTSTNTLPSPEARAVSLSDPMEMGRDGAVFAPGSAWLFVKAYCGPAAADRLLSGDLATFIQRLKRRNLVNRWFFIRYSDPDFHLRIRFHGRPPILLKQVLPALEKLFHAHLATGALVKWQLDTYRPETRRYGGPDGVQLAEEIFQVDSETVLTLLQFCVAEDGLGFRRWWLGLCGVDQLLNSLGLNPTEKLALVQEARQALASSCRVDAAREHELSQDFRRERKRLESLLHMTFTEDQTWAACFAAISQRSTKLLPIIKRVKKLETAGKLGVAPNSHFSMTRLAHSYIHMHVNRLLRSANQDQELVIYDAMLRLYKSEVARLNKTPSRRANA